MTSVMMLSKVTYPAQRTLQSPGDCFTVNTAKEREGEGGREREIERGRERERDRREIGERGESL